MTTTRSDISSGRTDDRYGYDLDESFECGGRYGCYVIIDKQTGDTWFGARVSKAGLAKVRREVDRLNAKA